MTSTEHVAHDALARWFTDGWRAQCVCGYVGAWHSRAIVANADAVTHTRTSPNPAIDRVLNDLESQTPAQELQP